MNNWHNRTAPEQSKMCTAHCISSGTAQAKRCPETNKMFYGFKFWIGYSYSKIKGYAFIVLWRIHFLGPNVWFLESKFWNALEQQQNEELPKEIVILIVNLSLSVHWWSKKNWSTKKKERCGAAPVQSFVLIVWLKRNGEWRKISSLASFWNSMLTSTA